MCEFFRAIPAHFYIFGGFWCGFGLFFCVLAGGFGLILWLFGVCLACFVAFWCIGRRCFWCMASILAGYLLRKK